MKKFVFSAIAAVVLLNSCEEVPPYIDFTVPPDIIKNSYVSDTLPTAQHKAVLIEDITGVRCINCPQAAQEIKNIIAEKTEDSVVSIALYTNHIPQLTTPWSNYPLLNSTISTEMVDFLGLPGGLPSGYVDRKIYAPLTERFVQYKSWKSYVNARLKESTPVNIYIKDSLQANYLTVDIKLVYTSSLSATHRVALYLIEDDIMSKQTGGTPTPETYVHNHVLRYAFGSSLGVPLYGTLVPGRTFSGRVAYELPSEYNKSNLKLLCVVTDAKTYEVVNVRQIHVK